MSDDSVLDINSVNDLETNEIIIEFAEKQNNEFLQLLVCEIKELRKRVHILEKKLKR